MKASGKSDMLASGVSDLLLAKKLNLLPFRAHKRSPGPEELQLIELMSSTSTNVNGASFLLASFPGQ